jgi:hypothetical protein
MYGSPFPFFPQRASTFAPRVDALMLYVFLISLFFRDGDRAADPLLHVGVSSQEAGGLPNAPTFSLAIELI